MTDPVRRGRRQLLGMALLFFAPLVAAILVYFVFPSLQPEAHTNYGTLLTPARPLPALRFVDDGGAPRDETALRGKWGWVLLQEGDCDPACAAKLHQVRQIRTLLNEKRVRTRRVYVAPDAARLAAARAALAQDHPDLLFLAAADFAAVRAFFGAAPAGTLFLVDPLGNYLMRYPPEAESPGILKDIRRLLRVSQIG